MEFILLKLIDGWEEEDEEEEEEEEKWCNISVNYYVLQIISKKRMF